jgi:hypothetical protein
MWFAVVEGGGMSDTPWPAEGLALIAAFNRVYGPEDWRAARERLEEPIRKDELERVETEANYRRDAALRPRVIRGRDGNVDLMETAKWQASCKSAQSKFGGLGFLKPMQTDWNALKLKIDAAVKDLLWKRFIARVVAGEWAIVYRMNPLADQTQLTPSQLQYFDLNSRSREAIAVGPNGRLAYDVRVCEHPWTSAHAVPPSRATAVEQEEATSTGMESKPRGKPGAPEIYDWEALKTPLTCYVEKNRYFASIVDLANWCMDNVKRKPASRHRKDGSPDPKTAKSAISKYGLDKIGLRPV